jgi:hypothetical protein
VIPLGGEFGPHLLDALRRASLLEEDALWWFALAEDELSLPTRCREPQQVFARPWDRVSLFGPRAELRWQRRGRGGAALLLLEAERPPELADLPAGKAACFPEIDQEPTTHLLWGEKQRLGDRLARGQVGFPRPLDYLASETDPTLDGACVLTVCRYADPRERRQALRYLRLDHLPPSAWERCQVKPFPVPDVGPSNIDTEDF